MRSSSVLVVLVLAHLFTVGCSGPGDGRLPEAPAEGALIPMPEDPHREFDFWHGEWDVANKHLRGGRWVDSGTARALIQPVAEGNAVLEQWNGELGGDPLIGFSLRAFNPDLGKWEIYLNWHGGEPGSFSLMHGERGDERIELFPPDDNTRYRYTFSRAHEGSCQWDQATSKDGESWVTDWIMHFTRRDDPHPADASNAPVVTPPDSAAKFPKTRELDFLLGSWRGQTTNLDSDDGLGGGLATMRVSSMIEGFGLMVFLDTALGDKSFAALGYDQEAQGWIAIRADTSSNGLDRMIGEVHSDQVHFRSDSGKSRLRESWTRAGETTLRWERLISEDGGATWQTVMSARFERE